MNKNAPLSGTMPQNMVEFSRTKVFTESTVPDKLRKHHRLSKDVWGLLRVTAGMLTYSIDNGPAIEVGQEQSVVIPPETLHFVTPGGHVSFDIAFFKSKNAPEDSCCSGAGKG